MMRDKRIQWLALVLVFFTEACSPEEPAYLPLDKIIMGNWQLDSYLTDPLVGWREQGSSGLVHVAVNSNTIVITQFSRYKDSESQTYELEITSMNQDTIRTGDWKTVPWHVFEANKRLFRRDNSDNDGSIWIQSGSHHIILDRIDED